MFAIALISTGLGGCATQSAYDELLESNRALTDRNQALLQENESLQAAQRSLQSAVEGRERSLSELRNLNADLRAENLRLKEQLASFDERLTGLRFGELDPQTDRALRQLAQQYPDLIIYDSDRGMLRFASDLTFASGSAEVTDNARQSLQRLARVLRADTAAGYDVKVLGHTDSQPIGAATAQRHPTNMHLSAHRAISVRNVLVSEGLTPERFEVAGRGEFDPLVPNTPTGNTPQNRRVEIYLVPASPRGAGAPQPTRRESSPTPQRRQDDIMK